MLERHALAKPHSGAPATFTGTPLAKPGGLGAKGDQPEPANGLVAKWQNRLDQRQQRMQYP